MSQTAVTEQGRGFEGGKAGLRDDVISRAAEGRFPFGRLAVLGTNQSTQGKLPGQASDVTTDLQNLGMSIRDLARENSDPGLEPAYKDKDSLGIMRKGDIFLKPEQAVTPLSALFVRFKGKKQVQTLVFDGDLVTSNQVDGSIGGVAIVPVVFDTSHDITMDNLGAAVLAANANILSAVKGGASNRTLTIITNQDAADQDLGGDFVVTLGAGQAGVVEAETQVAVKTDQIGKVRTDSDDDEASAATAAALPVGNLRAVESVIAAAVGKFHVEMA